MNPELSSYKKISGKFFTLLVVSSLWKGEDHLLWVERAIVQERYKRFYYNDIQAMLVVKNNHQHAWTVFWGVLILLFGVIAWNVSGTPYVSGFFAGMCMLMLMANLFMGPSCKTYLKTAVQQETLTHLVRLKKAKKTLGRIHDLVEQKQGGVLPSTILQARAWETRPMGKVVDSSIPDSTGNNSLLHWGLYVLLGLTGVGKCLQIRLQSPGFSVLDLFALAVLLVLAIAVLVRQRGKYADHGLRVFDWLALGLVVLQAVATYILFMMAIFRNPEMAYNQWAVLGAFIKMLNEGNPLIAGVVLGFGLAGAALGATGMIILAGKKK